MVPVINQLPTREQFFRFIRFGLVGSLTFIFYYVLLIIFVELKILSISIASAASYLIAVISNYLLHYFWTFDAIAQHKVVGRKYLVMVGSGFCINVFSMTYLIPNDGSYYLLFQAVVLVFIVIWNYLLSTYWVFR